MNPSLSYYVDGFTNDSSLFSDMGRGYGSDLDRPLKQAIQYNCVDVLKLMAAYRSREAADYLKLAERRASGTAAPAAGQLGPEFKQVSDALTRFLDENDDDARLELLQNLIRMGNKAVPPLIREAFSETGDPAEQPINVHKIRLAVWCGCALHPEAFKGYYRTKYKSGLSPRLDEMRAINMHDGMRGSTYVHRLLQKSTWRDHRDLLKEDGGVMGSGPELVKKLNDVSATKRYEATVEMARSGDPAFLEPLERAFLNDTDMAVLMNAANAIGKIGTERAGDILISYIRRYAKPPIAPFFEAELRVVAAAKALGKTSHPKARAELQSLLEAARDTNESVAMAAQTGLSSLANSK